MAELLKNKTRPLWLEHAYFIRIVLTLTIVYDFEPFIKHIGTICSNEYIHVYKMKYIMPYNCVVVFANGIL